ncbi:hypothetical protein NP233_g11625 [Leucocoprinus birnbaumii]|uniref:G domain-containing protein n=1 Tax=Leucocoprinus birnbaumii TaxID=56174 RepID=A0AAD5VG30_9AGAR|nr:hypothetical protein NP233_g11625 [Leucocoprinus birnbaumii]
MAVNSFQRFNFEKIHTMAPIESYELNNEDFIIMIMGAIGVGKTTFFQIAGGLEAGSEEFSSLDSGTSEVSALRITFTGNNFDKNLVLVDTPGFNNPQKTDWQILETIVRWLNDAGTNNTQGAQRGVLRRISGILYLHRITDARFAFSSGRVLEIFTRLCGENFFNRVFLTTTMWPENSADDEEEWDQSLPLLRELRFGSHSPEPCR